MKNYNEGILIVATEFPPGPGGIGSHTYSMAKAFVNNGIKTKVIATADYVSAEQIADFDAKQPFEIVRFKRGGIKSYFHRFLVAKSNICKNVIVSGKFALWIGLWLKIVSPSTHIIGVLHGSEVNLPNPILRSLTHLSIYSLSEIIAVSKYTKTLVPQWIRNKRVIHIIPNGIDLKSLDKETNQLELAGSPSLLTVGNVTPRKGQQRVIKAMPEILKKHPHAHYHIVGLPTFKTQFAELATKLGVEQNVTFHGRIDKFEDLFNYYSSSDVFMILSENQQDGDVEGFGIVVLEAGYFCLPTIGAKGCGIEDAVKDDYNGYLVDGYDVDMISNAITKVQENKERLSIDAKQWALDHNWDKIINRFIKLLK